MDLSDYRLKLAIIQDLEAGNVPVVANPAEAKLEKKVGAGARTRVAGSAALVDTAQPSFMWFCSSHRARL